MTALGGLVNPANTAIFQQRFSIPSTFETPSDPPLPRDAEALAVRAPATDALFVDLDGTLVFTDMFAEGLLSAVRLHPRRFFDLLTQLPQGYAACKRTLAKFWKPDFDHLPLNEEIVAMIQQSWRCI